MEELELDHCFWNAASTSPEFLQWLISQTKFAERALRLVTNEKWHQRWYRDPQTGEESETDILLMLEDIGNGERFALHVENKPPHGKWRPNQPENYRKRAQDRMVPWRYADFQTVLLAPAAFISLHQAEAAHFDLRLTYEEVSAWIHEFTIAA